MSMEASSDRLRLVIQRARHVRVIADGLDKGSFDHGLVVYAGFGRYPGATQKEESQPSKANIDAVSLSLAARKIFDLRTFADESTNHDRMHLSVRDIKGGVALISQFTLWADCRKGNRPGFQLATPPEAARHAFERLVDQFRSAASQSQDVTLVTGVFGANMAVSYVNDGPVTYLFDVAQGQIHSL